MDSKMNGDMSETIQSTDTLFQLAQLLRVFPDSKTMVDAIRCQDKSKIDAELGKYLEQCAGDLEEILGGQQALNETDQPDLQYQVLKVARRLNKLTCQLESLIQRNFSLNAKTSKEAPYSASMEQHIERMWWALTRYPGDRPKGSNLLELRHPYVVAGGRYLDFYYWDSYYTAVGLLASGRIQMLENVVNNMAELIERYDHIPNGTRTYYRTRSQAPYFAMTLQLLAKAKGEAAARQYSGVLAKEHNFWSSSKRTHLIPGSGGLKLNHYWDDICPQVSLSDEDLLHTMARPEGYREDIQTCYQAADAGVPEGEWQRILIDLRAACESGWDFSSRWLQRGQHGEWPLWTIRTSSILPIDLNCLLYSMERLLGRWKQPTQNTDSDVASVSFDEQAEQRRLALGCDLFWKQRPGWFYDVVVGPHGELVSTGADSLAGVFPLFCKVATPQQAEAVARRIEARYLRSGGVVTSLEEFRSGQQWDFPNGWAPLQWATIAGLVNYDYDDLAREIARRFVDLARQVYDRTGKMMEKYNVVDLECPGGGGEYANQVGFGWTNSIVRACIEFLDGNTFWRETRCAQQTG